MKAILRSRRMLLLRDAALALLAVPPWLIGFLAGCLVRLVLAFVALALWMTAAARAGYDAARDRRERDRLYGG